MVLVPFSVLMMLGHAGGDLGDGAGLHAPTKPIFDLAVTFGRITFPYLVFISLASLYGGVLNGIDRFAEVAFTPVLLNIAADRRGAGADADAARLRAIPPRSALPWRASCNGCGCSIRAGATASRMKLVRPR